MHRSITIACPPEATGALVATLEANENVLFLSVSEGGAKKPKGDVVTVHVLNLGADDVMNAAIEAEKLGEISVSTEESASIVRPGENHRIERDIDEAQFEEVEATLRHQARLSPNSFALCLLAGIISAGGMVTEDAPQATLLIAASIIAPVYEPVAKIPLGIVLGRWGLVVRGVRATLASYTTLALGAGLAFAAFIRWGGVDPVGFLGNSELGRISVPELPEYATGAAAAFAGIVMLASYRRSVIAGPLIALAIVQTTSSVGMTLALGRFDRLLPLLQRLGIDMALIVISGLIVFGGKQLRIHRRPSLMSLSGK